MAQPALKEPTLEERALTYPEQARAITINNSADYLAAGEFVKAVDSLAREVDASFKPGIQKAHDLHKSLIAERDRHLKPLTEAKTLTKRLMVSYDHEQERKRREIESRLREDARRREEEAQLAAALEAEAAGIWKRPRPSCRRRFMFRRLSLRKPPRRWPAFGFKQPGGGGLPTLEKYLGNLCFRTR